MNSELETLLRDAVNSFAEDAESLSDRIYWIIENKLTESAATNDQIREAFNAGYSYGLEDEGSPEEYDCAWQLYQQSGRTGKPDA